MNDEILKIAKKIEKLKREFSMLPPLTQRYGSLEIEEYQHYLLEMEELIIVFNYLSKQKPQEHSFEIPSEEKEAVSEPEVIDNVVEIPEREEEQAPEIDEVELPQDIEEKIELEPEFQNEVPAEEIENENIEDLKEENSESKVEMVATGASLNDQIKTGDNSLASKFAKQPISDLRSAFGLNERFLYANELFGGDGQEFSRALNELNHLENFEDAKRMIEARYENNFGWKSDDENVIAFVEVVERRYL